MLIEFAPFPAARETLPTEISLDADDSFWSLKILQGAIHLGGRLSELRFVESNQHSSSVFGWYDLLCISRRKEYKTLMSR